MITTTQTISSTYGASSSSIRSYSSVTTLVSRPHATAKVSLSLDSPDYADEGVGRINSASKLTQPSDACCESRIPHAQPLSLLPGWLGGSGHAPKLRHYSEVPRYLQDNDFIHTGYRSGYTYKQSWASFFRLHNESGNVWTHSVAFCIFFSSIFLMATSQIHPAATVTDKIVIGLFLLCGSCTFLFSSLFHLHLCISESAYAFWGCLDYSGISALVCGTTATVAYYLFYCNPVIRTAWIATLVVVNMVGVLGPRLKVWSTSAFRVYRTLVYISSGVLSGGPVVHYCILNGINLSLSDLNATWFYAGSVGLYLTGAVFYVLRFPERALPGKFDLLLHSHQIWHVFVMTAAYVSFQGLLHLMEWRLNQGVCPARS
ncbi:hemolysin-III related-domain-containing protein [Polychytrium aggregatum]|uniref:hemolysin-III related-domain-containing protein n=1 Tax=Polychytrium aggregatum TaxID=110093 RepID=UPI0022FEC9F9|nr:hemolysin-III related-domain-containing protein [Polychytrium aggregatum]KAI9197057.1 hemolysin-III related-domain-containing protein [Polychytrium aggregatum]